MPLHDDAPRQGDCPGESSAGPRSLRDGDEPLGGGVCCSGPTWSWCSVASSTTSPPAATDCRRTRRDHHPGGHRFRGVRRGAFHHPSHPRRPESLSPRHHSRGRLHDPPASTPIGQGSRVEHRRLSAPQPSPARLCHPGAGARRAASRPIRLRHRRDMMFALHYLEVTEPDQIFLPLGSGAMGTGLAMAMGLQGGLPDVPVVCITGDGCMEMHGMELVTAVAERIPVVIAVFNDARMGMVRFGLQKFFGRSLDYGTRPVDFAALARSVGAEGRTVSSADDLSPGAFRAAGARGAAGSRCPDRPRRVRARQQPRGPDCQDPGD